MNQWQLDAVVPWLRPRRRRVRQGDHGLAFVRRIAAGDKGVELIEVGGIGGGPGAHRIGLGHRPLRHDSGMDVVGRDFLDRRFLGDIVEAQRPAGAVAELVIGPLLVLGARRDLGRLALVVGRPGQVTVGRAFKLDMVPRLVRQGERQGLAAVDIGVPVGQREIVVAAGQARAVIDAGPGRLVDPVRRLVHEFLDVTGVAELDLADRRHQVLEFDRHIARPIPAVAQVPFSQGLGVRQVACGRGRHRRRLVLREGGNLGIVQHMVVDAQLVVIGTAHEVVAAHHLVRRDGPAGRAELVEAGVEDRDLVLVRHFTAVDIELDATGLVPRHGDMRPLVGLGQCVQLERQPHPRQVVVGDEGVVAVAVIIDAQPHHVPRGVIGVADAEQHEGRAADRRARAPEERHRTALGVNIARRLPGQHMVVRRRKSAARIAIGHDIDLAGEVRHRLAPGIVGGQALVGRQVEKQAILGVGGARSGRGQGDQAGAQRQNGFAPIGDVHGFIPSSGNLCHRCHSRLISRPNGKILHKSQKIYSPGFL